MQRVLLLPLLVLLLPISSASADPIIVIQSGSIVVTPFELGGLPVLVDIDLRGSSAFHVQEHGNSQGWGACIACPPLLRHDFGGFGVDDESGVAQLGRESFPLGSSNNVTVITTAPGILPPLGTSGVVSLPFDLRGSVSFLPDDDPLALPIQFDLVGHGTVTARMTPESNGLFWAFAGSRFQFGAAPAPTPEPATLLLLGSGLAGTIWTRRRTRRRSDIH